MESRSVSRPGPTKPIPRPDNITLPFELFRPIIEHIPYSDRRTLHALLLSSKVLSHEAEKQLYNSIVLRGVYKNRLFLRSVGSVPRLAYLVYEYRISIDPLREFASEGFQAALRDGLRAFVNLRIFDYHTAHQDTMGVIPDLLTGCTFKLRCLIWNRALEEELLSAFLLEQQDLEEVSTEWERRKVDLLAPSACPNLVFFCGNIAAMDAFLPNRSVIRLRMVYSTQLDPQPPSSLDHLQAPLGKIRSLRLGGHAGRPPLSMYAHLLPSVQILQLEQPQTDDFRAVHRLKRLSTLVVTYSDPDESRWLPWTPVNQLFTSNEVLGHILTGYSHSEEYTEYTRTETRTVCFSVDSFF